MNTYSLRWPIDQLTNHLHNPYNRLSLPITFHTLCSYVFKVAIYEWSPHDFYLIPPLWLFHYGKKKVHCTAMFLYWMLYIRKKTCRNPGLNQGPLDLQSNALPTELFRLHLYVHEMFVLISNLQCLNTHCMYMLSAESY